MIKSRKEAKQKILNDAAARAYKYIEREAPGTLDAIQFYVSDGADLEEITDAVTTAYDITEEKVRHKIKLVAQALIAERDS